MMNKRRSCVQDLIRPKTPTISGIPTQGSLQPQQPFFQGPKPHRASPNVPKDIPAGGDFSSGPRTSVGHKHTQKTGKIHQPNTRYLFHQKSTIPKQSQAQTAADSTITRVTLEHSKTIPQVTCPKSTS